MKKLISSLILFAYLSSVALAAGLYPDLPEDHPNAKAIEFLSERKIIEGYPNGNMKPDKLVSRAEAMKIITVALNLNVEGNYQEVFSDVKEKSWFFKYVMAARANNIVQGYGDGSFKPNSNVNLAESLVMLTLALKVNLSDEVEGELYFDVDGGDWFAKHFEYARERNLVVSDKSGLVNPYKSMSRSEFSELIYRALKVNENNDQAFDLSEGWKDYQSDEFPFSGKYDAERWELIERDDQLVFFKADQTFDQFSESRTYPNSAAVKVSLDENEAKISKNEYFNNLKEVFAGANFREFKFEGFDALEIEEQGDKTLDWYIYLDGGKVMVIFTEIGNGLMSFELERAVDLMLSNLKYQKLPDVPKVDQSALKNEIFKRVLVDGAGKEILDQINDKLIIGTDAIGVGTGPIDYYYSESLKMTLKYLRNSDTILDVRDSESTAF